MHRLTYLKFHNRYTHTLVIGSTHADCAPLWSKHFPCFAHEDLHDSAHPIPIDRRSADVSSPVALKWYYALRLLQLGLKPLFADGDVVFMRDPFLMIDTAYHMQGLSDFLTPTDIPLPYADCPMYTRRQEPCQSTGIMYFEISIPTIAFVNNMWERLLATRTWSLEQPIANYELPKYIHYGGLKHRLFPDAQASNCALVRTIGRYHGWMKTIRSLVAMHVGYLNRWYKADAYHRIQLWLPDENYKRSLVFPHPPEHVSAIADLVPVEIPADFCLMRGVELERFNTP